MKDEMRFKYKSFQFSKMLAVQHLQAMRQPINKSVFSFVRLENEIEKC